MTHRDSQQRVGELFLRASDLPQEEREAYLDGACRDEPRIRDQVEALLQAGGASPLTPGRIGPYRIVEQIGEGGQGVVYRALQTEPIRREVAVKIILPGFETRRVVARFKSEQEALARMHHPNIAGVLDAGTTDAGQPYFVMEYVAGLPITEYCDRSQLTLERRLELFREVCEGVQHAHRKAILHRDLKPTNILVTERDGAAIPKIIDFGVAKALERSGTTPALVTEAGRSIGTPGYMSPEQATTGGDLVDTRSDVYALGVLLYELVSGAQPFDLESVRGRSHPDELRRAILEIDPPPPSARLRALDDHVAAGRRGLAIQPLIRRISGELDWIALKALHKDRELRYASPSQLSADVGRFLRHEPVRAGPPSAWYRAHKFVRRHRAGVAVAAVALLFVAAFASAAILQAKRAGREAERARQESENVRELTEFLVADLFPVGQEIGPRVDRLSARELLVNSTDGALAELADQPLLRFRMQHTLGNVHRRMGLHPRALPLLVEACAGLAAQLGPLDPSTLVCARDLARTYLNLHRFEEAETSYAEVLAARRAIHGEDALETLRAMNDLAYTYKAWGRHRRAALLFEETVAGLRRVLGEEHPETLISSGFLAGVYLELDRLDDLEPLLIDLVESARRVLGEDHLETHAAWYNLGCLLARRGEVDRAIESLRMAIDRGFSTGYSLRADPHLESLRGNPRLESLERAATVNAASRWNSINREAEAAYSRGDLETAEELFRDVLQAALRQSDLDQVEARVAMDYLAYIYLGQERFAEAEAILLEWLERQRKTPMLESSGEEYILWCLAQCDLAAGRKQQALDRIVEARALIVGSPLIFRSAYLEAVERFLRGDRRGTLDSLNRAAEMGRSQAFRPGFDVTFTELRGDPEFDEIVKRMARSPAAD